MDTALLKLLYGTDDEKVILKSKTTEKQVRAVANGKSGALVDMSPEECAKLCKAAGGVEFLEGYEHRVLQYRITDETVDRYGDIVRAKGVRLENYKKNPVVQFAHNYEEPPVGVSLKTWYDRESNSVFAWPLFMDDRHDTTGKSELVFRLARANVMRACSIGFVPIDVYNPGNDEERKKLGLGDYGVEFKKCDLMEFSPVAVPANPNALHDDYRDGFVRGLRAAGFGKRHLDTLRKYPILADNAIDALIVELDARRVAIIADGASIEKDAVLRPYPNEHAARLKDPDGFDDFRRKADGKLGEVEVPKTADVIWGHIDGGAEDEWAAQAIRFPTANWTEDSAKSWLEENKVSYIAFEPAAEKDVEPMKTNGQTTTTADDQNTRATNVTVNLDCDNLLKGIEQLQTALNETKQLYADGLKELREMVSTVRGALADNTKSAPKPPININLYDDVLKLKR